MTNPEPLVARFERERPRLRAMAYRMLGSWAEADDAVQEAWLRLDRSDATRIENLAGWLTTVVGHVCLDALRRRDVRAESPLDAHVPDLAVSSADAPAPEAESVLADEVGLAMSVVLGTLAPPERVALVLHDMFDVPFADVAALLDRTPDATKMLASRARAKLRARPVTPDVSRQSQRGAVDAFLTAARAGDFDGLVSVLAPDVILRSDAGPERPDLTDVVRGAATVAGRATLFAAPDAMITPVLVNGVAGIVASRAGRPFVVMAFVVAGGRIVAIDVLVDPGRLATMQLPAL